MKEIVLSRIGATLGAHDDPDDGIPTWSCARVISTDKARGAWILIVKRPQPSRWLLEVVHGEREMATGLRFKRTTQVQGTSPEDTERRYLDGNPDFRWD